MTINHRTKHDVVLKYMELADVQALLRMENDEQTWQYSRALDAPYTLAQIDNFVRSAPRFLVDGGQLRFMIWADGVVVGAIDLYDYQQDNRSARVAILIYPASMRGRGIGRKALQLLIEYCVSQSVTSLYAEVACDNVTSRAFFTDAGFFPSDNLADIFALDLSKSRHLIVGQHGEQVAEHYLIDRGFEIVDRNWRAQGCSGEIDIIASRDGALYFVEVKTRSNDAVTGDFSPQTALNPSKLKRLSAITEHYITQTNFLGEVFNYLITINLVRGRNPIIKFFPFDM